LKVYNKKKLNRNVQIQINTTFFTWKRYPHYQGALSLSTDLTFQYFTRFKDWSVEIISFCVILVILDKSFIDNVPLNKIQLDKTFKNNVPINKIQLIKTFIDNVPLNKIELVKTFIDNVPINKIQLDKSFYR